MDRRVDVDVFRHPVDAGLDERLTDRDGDARLNAFLAARGYERP